jgi:hypothetical protein
VLTGFDEKEVYIINNNDMPAGCIACCFLPAAGNYCRQPGS